MFYFKLGWRNILKNLRQTSLTMATLVIGMASLAVFSGSNSYLFREFSERIIKTQYGHFQLYAGGFLKNGRDCPFDYLIHDYKKVIEKLKMIPHVKFAAPRLSFNGLISGDKDSTVIMGLAGMPEEEKLMDSSLVTNGDFISADDQSGLVAGDLLLGKLEGNISDTFTIMATMRGGGINGIDARVKGVRKGYGEFDKMSGMFVLANLKKIQNLLNVGESADTIVVMLDSTLNMPAAEPAIKEICRTMGLEYKRWDELAVFFESVKDMFNMNILILTIIIIAILIFIIANTMSMNLLERTREIGTIRALGTTRIKVAGIFLAESALIGAIGSFAGIIAGLIIAFAVNLSGGIYHKPSSAASNGYTTFIEPELSGLIMYFVIFIAAAVLSAVSTAGKAAKTDISEALRSVS